MRLFLHLLTIIYLIDGHQSLAIDQLREYILTRMLQVAFGLESAPPRLRPLPHLLFLLLRAPLIYGTEMRLTSRFRCPLLLTGSRAPSLLYGC